jgi:hypothetical protein
MSPAEWEGVVIEVRALWGSSAKWARADQAYDMVIGLDRAETMAVVHSMFRNGSANAPSMSEVIAGVTVRQVGTTNSSLENPLECSHPQPWGFDIIDGKRIAFCRYCYSEWEAPNVKSIGEIAEAKETRNIPT